MPVDKLCGEFLSAEAQAYLRQLGFDAGQLGGQRITHLRLVRGNQVITTKLPFEGIGLTRKTLDEALLDHAGQAGVTVRRGYGIRHISAASEIAVQVEDLGVLRPKTLLLATGKHEARGAARRCRPSSLVGFKTYFRLAPAQHRALAGHVELLLFPGGYAGLQLVEGQKANFCVLVEAALLRRVGGKWPNLLEQLQVANPHLATRLSGADSLLAAPLSIAGVPYGFIHQSAADDPAGLFRLGDQAAVIQSFTGDGMAIALHSAARAAQSVLAGGGAADYHLRLAADISGQIRRAAVLHFLLSTAYLAPAMFWGAKTFPKLLALSAALTRVPERARILG